LNVIQEHFEDSLRKHTDDRQISIFWQELEVAYTKSSRHYHTLVHLDNLVGELLLVQMKIKNWDAIIFAIAYHDIVYNTLKKNNEEKSAKIAVERLTKLSIPEQTIKACEKLILATKAHELSDEETNFFTDADLSILGADEQSYKTYTRQIRLEYAMYPDLLYNTGRKKVLTHFLKMKTIYKTTDFINKYESSARVNLLNELKLLA
jgi:predicted metal-dependent HD superfamily phosphohydrolase